MHFAGIALNGYVAIAVAGFAAAVGYGLMALVHANFCRPYYAAGPERDRMFQIIHCPELFLEMHRWCGV